MDGLIVVRALRIVPTEGATQFPGSLFLATPERADALSATRPPSVEVLAEDDPVAVAFRAGLATVTAEERTGRRAEDEPTPVPVFPEPETPKKAAPKKSTGTK